MDGIENEGARKPEKRGRDEDLKATLTTASSASAASPSANASTELSFQELINDIAVEQKQKDVSLSFYFICLLHLANEKVIKLLHIYYIQYFSHYYSLNISEFGNCTG
jgi:hypothetical protein